MKRENYISWDEYFMGIALLSSQRSKDPLTQVGACIVDEDKKIIGVGYNGFPRGCSDEAFSWSDDVNLNFLENKHAYVVHAEANAILNLVTKDAKNATLYVTLSPCNECAKLIIQSGIKKVIYIQEKPNKEYTQATKKMFDAVGIVYEKFQSNQKKIILEF